MIFGVTYIKCSLAKSSKRQVRSCFLKRISKIILAFTANTKQRNFKKRKIPSGEGVVIELVTWSLVPFAVRCRKHDPKLICLVTDQD